MSLRSESHDQFTLPLLQQEFTGRASLIAIFEELLQEACPVPVLAFFGIGGSGKTWLINYLAKTYAQSPANGESKRLYALINFRPGHTGTSPQESLWSIRSQLARQRKHLSFGRFDLIWGVLWEKTHQISIRNNKVLLPEEIEEIADILGALEDLPFVGKIAKGANLLYKNWHKTHDWQKRRKVSEWVYSHVEDKRPTGFMAAFGTGVKALKAEEISRLESLLPIALAADLADISPKGQLSKERILLFIDTFEFLEEGVRKVFGLDKDTYIQGFAEQIERMEANVLITITSRNSLRWAQVQRHDGQLVLKNDSLWASGTTINDPNVFRSRHLRQYRVEEFSNIEAEEYLRDKCGVRDALLVSEIVKITAGYPLALATIAQLFRKGADVDTNELTNLKARLINFNALSPQWRDELCTFLLERIFEQLKRGGRNDLISLMRAASVPRWFDVSFLFEMSPREGLHEQINELAEHPFVELHTKRGPGGLLTYSVHSVVRKLLLETFGSTEERVRLHKMAKLSCQKGKVLCRNPEDGFAFDLEEIYHAAEVDRISGFGLAEGSFARELERTRFDRCESILETLRDVSDWSSAEEAQILTLAGRLRMISGEYEIALKCFKKAKILEPLEKGFAPFRATIVYYCAECHRQAGNYLEALENCNELRATGIKYRSNFTVMLADWRALLTYKLLDEVPKALEIYNRLESFRDGDTDAEAASFGVRSPLIQMANFRRQASELRRYVGDYVGAANSLDFCLSIYSPDSLEYAYTKLSDAHLLRMEGKWDEAWRAADQADGIFARTLVHKRGVLSVVRTRGLIAYARANEDAAARYFEQLIDCSPRIFPYGPMYGHLGRGELARINRKHSDARYHYGKAIECCLGLHGRIERAYAILGLAEVARQEGGYEDAVHSVLEARNIGRECGYPWLEFYSNLVGSLSTFGTKRAGFLAAAGEFGLRFRRRENDKNLENHIYQQVIKNLASGQAIAPLRFNFP